MNTIKAFFLLLLLLPISCKTRSSRNIKDQSISEEQKNSDTKDASQVINEKPQEQTKLPFSFLLAGAGEGIISVNAAAENKSLQLTDESPIDSASFLDSLKENQAAVLSSAVAVSLLAGAAIGHYARPYVQQVKLHMGKDVPYEDKVVNFILQHRKNLKKEDAKFFKAIKKEEGENGKLWNGEGAHAPEKIGDRLVLGALPDDSRLNAAKAPGSTDISILSIVESFEMNIPLKYKDKNGVEQTFTPFTQNRNTNKNMHISSEDYRPVSTDSITNGADYIADRIAAGDTVYVHCKSGKGRSATLVAAYLVKYQHMSVDQAVQVIKRQRPEVSVAAGGHYKALKEWEALRAGKL